MKSVLSRGLYVPLSVLPLSLIFVNCTKADFGLTEEGQLEAQGIYSYDTAFVATTESNVPVDPIWIIDNSGSMDNEAAHVRANFQTFARRLEASTDFRLALISLEGTSGTAVSLPFTGAKYRQVNLSVGSTDALEIAQYSIAPNGSLGGFLRPLSKKIFIVVTDDESRMSANSFKANFAQYYPPSQLTVFAFASKAAVANCSVSKVGSVYNSLAETTGGSVYEICNTDWTATFKHLVDAVIAISNNTLKMPQTDWPILRILDVYLNGELLKDTDFQFDGSIVSIEPNRLSGVGIANVRVVYQVNLPKVVADEPKL